MALISCLTLGNELSRWASPLCLALQLGHHLYTQLFLGIMLHTMTLQIPKESTCLELQATNTNEKEGRKDYWISQASTGFIKTHSAVEHRTVQRECSHKALAVPGLPPAWAPKQLQLCQIGRAHV